MSAIAECPRCKALVFYRNNSDLLDGHRCPDGSAPWIEDWKRDAAVRQAHRQPTPGGPVGDEVSDLDQGTPHSGVRRRAGAVRTVSPGPVSSEAYSELDAEAGYLDA